MLVGWRMHLALAGVAFCTGCGGAVSTLSGSGTGDGAATGSGGATTVDSGAGGRSAGGRDARTDTSADRAQACRLYFKAMFTSQCSDHVLPENELGRLAPLFEESCVEEFDMPGNVNTASALNACVDALQLSDCASPDGPPLACDIRGSLPGGAPCIVGTQCQSGRCDGTTPGYTPGGPLGGADTCGTCTAAARTGETCPESCEKGARCFNTTPDGPDYHPVCLAITEGDNGEPCDDHARLCRPGSFCNNSRVCEKLPALGEPCPSLLCAPPFVCRRTGGNTWTCQPPGNIGDACGYGDGRCAAGLACDENNRCAVPVWVGPGEVCDDTHLCHDGKCYRRPGPGTCPMTVPDGEPCAADSQCDTLSLCLNPDAPHGVAMGICGSPTGVICAG